MVTDVFGLSTMTQFNPVKPNLSLAGGGGVSIFKSI